MKGLLNTSTWTWEAFFNAMFKTASDETNSANFAVSNTLKWITNGIWIVIGVVGLCGVVYAIWLGIQLARADEQSKRDDAKKHLITVIIALAVTLVLVLFFLHILPAIVFALSGAKITDTKSFIHF